MIAGGICDHRTGPASHAPTTMPSESPTPSGCGLSSFCRSFKNIFIKASRPSVLLPVLRLVEQAAPAFPPLQSAASGLVNVIERTEVRDCFSLQLDNTSLHACATQKASRNKMDVVGLQKSFFQLLEMLQGPLSNASTCPLELRERINRLARSLHCFLLHVLLVASDIDTE